MKSKKIFTARAIAFIIIASAIGVYLAFGAFNNYIYQEKQGDGNTYEPYRATLTGEYVCLPHRDTTGPQTLECAYGIQTEAGEYYAVDFGLMSQTPPNMAMGETFTASGTITPIERLSTDQWQKYNVQGIFSITDSVELGK